MTLKHLFVLPALLFAFVVQAQTGTFDKINVRSSLKLQDKTITEVTTDTSLISSSDSKLPTERAVKKYIDNNPSLIKKAGGGIIKENDSIYLGGAYDNFFLYAGLEGYGNYFLSNLDGWQMGTYRPEGDGGVLSMDNLGYSNLKFDVYDNVDHATYLFSKDSFCILDKNSAQNNPNGFTFYRDGRLMLHNFKNAASGLNFLSTDANGYLKFNPLKKGNGISSIGDSLYLGGEISESGLGFYTADGSTYYSLGGGNLFMDLFNPSTGLDSYMQIGNGTMIFDNITYNGIETQLSLDGGGLYFKNAGSYTFYVDALNTTHVSRLNIGVVHSSDFEQPLLNRTGSVVLLDNLTQNKTLILNSPDASKGDVWYIFNSNTSTEFSYTLNYPIYKSGNVSITTIPGNTEFRAMIVSDGTKWIQLN